MRLAPGVALVLIVPLAWAAGGAGQGADVAGLAGAFVDGRGSEQAPPALGLQAWIWSDPRGDADRAGLDRLLQGFDLPAHSYTNLGMVAFMAEPAAAKAIARLTGGRVEANAFLPVHLDKSVPAIEADRVKEALGLRRNGPTVLVIDTGVDSTHPDFQAGNLAANAQAVRQGGLVIATVEQIPVVDASGHGTHVAGIAAGSGESLGASDSLHGRYEGVYSNGRVASYQASGVDEGEEAAVEVLAALEAFDWAVANRQRFDLRVISNSWGERGTFDPDSAIHQATLRLYLEGFTILFSAGNSGEDGAGTLNRYCIAPWVLCVAAADLDGSRMSFSSYGANDPERPYDHPDVSGPGLSITSAKPLNGLALRDLTRLLGGGETSASLYSDRSGTSMAVPHVAGVAALIQAANAGLSPDDVMDIIVASASPMADGVSRAGSGFLDARVAYNLAVATEGNRADFLAGRDVKYAGPLSRDTEYANDAVSVGYDGSAGDSPLALDRVADGRWFVLPFAWVLFGVAGIAVLIGTRWRKRPEAVAFVELGDSSTSDARVLDHRDSARSPSNVHPSPASGAVDVPPRGPPGSSGRGRRPKDSE